MTSGLVEVDELEAAAARLDGAEPERILAWAFDTFPRVALVASFQAESSVLIDMACRLRPDVEIVTLDTGRLPQETLDLIDTVQRAYSARVHVISPSPEELAEMTGSHGVNLFYVSPELRQLCCDVRKSRPLQRALQGFDAWITGIRRDQASTRATTPVVGPDTIHKGLVKVAPLARWSHDQVWGYIRARGLPHHALYSQGYTSIGCAPCTRAAKPGETERAGRWWWEGEGVKECGLHWDNRAVTAGEAVAAPTIEGHSS